MRAKDLLIIFYFSIILLLFGFFKADWDVWLSFFGSGCILSFICIYHLFGEKSFSPFLSAFIVFNFLFFLVAPVVQINSFEANKAIFENKFPYREDLVIYSNVLISMFNTMFFLSYIYLKRRIKIQVKPIKSINKKILPLFITTLVVGTVLVFIFSFKFTLDEISRPNWQSSSTSTMALLLWKKVFFLIPFAGILLCFQYFEGDSKKKNNYVIIILFSLFFMLLLLWFKNPLTEKRNALGPIYISLMFLFLPRLFNSNVKMLFFLFFSMIIVFPMTAIITHSNATFDEILTDPGIVLEHSKGGISNAFNTLHYDAFSNIMATIDFVGQHGFAYGHQLLSAYLFFVPRGLWEAKPETTGQLVGDYLISDYNFNFNNLSNPLVSEGFINFGVIGVLVGAVLLALIIVWLLRWLNSPDYLKKIMAFYFAVHLIFLLRGDFTNGFSYYIGTLGGVLVIPKLIQFLLKQILIHPKNGNRNQHT